MKRPLGPPNEAISANQRQKRWQLYGVIKKQVIESHPKWPINKETIKRGFIWVLKRNDISLKRETAISASRKSWEYKA